MRSRSAGAKQQSGDRHQNVRSLGILGGTFDPIHFGHLLIAERAREQCGLESVLFMPNGYPPHRAQPLFTSRQRYDMCKLAVRGNPAFDVSKHELDHQGFHYTVDTLEWVRLAYPQVEMPYLIVGSDEAALFETWKDWERILTLCRLLIVSRPDKLSGAASRSLAGAYGGVMASAEGLEISATAIRGCLDAGKSVRYLTPDCVVKYMAQCQLPGGDACVGMHEGDHDS
jgi:nicotinate-nucleotide adenylyltransferase